MKNKTRISTYIVNAILSSISWGIVPVYVLFGIMPEYIPLIILFSVILGILTAWINVKADENYNWKRPNLHLAYAKLITIVLSATFPLCVFVFYESYTIISIVKHLSGENIYLPTLILGTLFSRLISIAIIIWWIFEFKKIIFSANLTFHHYTMDDGPEFIEWCEELLSRQKSAKKRWLIINRMQLSFDDSGRYADSIRVAETLSPASLKPNQKMVYYNNLIYDLLMTGRREEALAVYNNNARLFENNPSITHTLGLLNYTTGHFYDATEQFRKVLSSPPSLSCAFTAEIDLARTLIALNDFQNAEAELEKAEKLIHNSYAEWRYNDTRKELYEAIKNSRLDAPANITEV